MAIGSAFRDIANVLDEFENAGFEIVEPRSRDEEGSIAVEFGAIVPALEEIDAGESVEVAVRGASIDGDDRLVLDLAVGAAVDGSTESEAPSDPDAMDEEPRDAIGQETAETGDSDAETDAQETGSDADGGDGSPDAGERSDEPPAHRDPEKLRAAYETNDTFADMRDALETDVTAQTVRRQMIEHGIHEPGSRGTGSDERESADAEPSSETASADESQDASGPTREDRQHETDVDPSEDESDEHGRAGEDSESTATLADGIDLPDGTDLDDLKGAVRSSRTVYEVSRSLGTDRELTRRLLSELDLLDLVTGRISAERDVPAEEIDRRVERSAPGSA